MNHLPWRHETRPRPKVPFVCARCTDEDICSTSESFLQAFQQYTQDADATYDFNPAIAVVQCQTWLFFGLIRVLSEETGYSFALRDFVKPNDISVVDTACLLRLSQQANRPNGHWSGKNVVGRTTARWGKGLVSSMVPALSKYLYDSPGSDRYSGIEAFRRSDSHQLLSAPARTWLMRYIGGYMNHSYASKQDEHNTIMVLWSTALLHELIFRPQDESTSAIGYEVARVLNMTDFMANEMRLSGRCPTVLSRTNLGLSDVWALLATPLQPDGYAAAQVALHSECVDQDCRAFSTSEASHMPQHCLTCESQSDCEFAGLVDESILIDCLKRKVTPIVCSSTDHSGVHIKIVASDEVASFTAISHVWAGGLGNFRTHKLRACQLLHLHRLTSSSARLFSTAYYWLDTICIPLHDAHYKDEAIAQMAGIYASAKKVLVLDPLLQRTDARDLNRGELAAHIASSPWMARSWTLPEGALAIDLRMRFRHTTVSFDEVESSHGSLAGSQLRGLWRRDVDRFHYGQVRSITSSEDRIKVVWQELRRRGSTKITDIAAILPMFIDRSSGEILRLPADRRIHAILRSQTHLPMCLLFVPTLNTVGRWDPIFPNCSDAGEPIESSTYLRFISGNLLEMFELHELYILRCIQHTPLSDDFIVYEMVDGSCFEVTFPTVTTRLKESAPTNGDVLLMLPRSVVGHPNEEDTERHHLGLCFIMEPGTVTAEHAVFYQTIFWKKLANVNPSQPTTSSFTSFSSQSDRQAMFPAARFPSVQGNNLGSTYRLVLDMGMFSLKL